MCNITAYYVIICIIIRYETNILLLIDNISNRASVAISSASDIFLEQIFHNLIPYDSCQKFNLIFLFQIYSLDHIRLYDTDKLLLAAGYMN